MKPIDAMTDEEWTALVQRAVTLPDAPPALLQAAYGLWHLHRPRGDTAASPQSLPQEPGAVQRWLAVLGFDSWAQAPMAAGMRALRADTRQLLFTSEGGDVDLHIEAQAHKRFAVSGQVLMAGAAGHVAWSMARNNDAQPVVGECELDDASEFRLEGLELGLVQLTLHLRQATLVLPPVQLGPYGARVDT